jgi:spore germination cell wall hydrolase CwlJ-like protein
MTDRHMQMERIGNILAVVVAVLLASAMVALAQVPDTVKLTPPPAAAVTIELWQPSPEHVVPAPGAITQTSTAGEALKKLVAEHRCLAEVMYFEARGEREAGERAIAEVILHRLAEGSHGDTICSVVHEGEGAGQTFCQFTFACDGSLGHPRNPEDWRAARVVAARLLAGEGPGPDNTDGATYFHTVSVHPTWAPKMERITRIGSHIFYRAKVAAISVAFRSSLQ